MKHHAAPLLVSVLLAGAGACGGGNISGQLGATHFGDLSNAPAERSDGRVALITACQRPAAPGATPLTFRRTPYLQQVTDRGADLNWISSTQPSAMVDLAGPDGAALERTLPQADGTAVSPSGTTQWSAPLGPLAPATTYCYDVSDGSSGGERLGFRTAPSPGSGATVRFIAIGDSGGGGSDQKALRDQMATVPFDFMIHTGDIAYGSGTRTDFQDKFFAIYADYLKYFPVFPASGNHEYETEDAAPFREAFVLPANGGPDGLERWYSFNWGDVHFVALDTEKTGPVQAAWLEADLAANTLPWTIVYGHKPPFSSGDHGNDAGFRTYFVPIIEKYHVPLVLNGHDHDYERTLPQNGVTYVVTGGGGRGVRPVGTSAFTAFSDAVIHFTYVTITGDQLALHAIDALGQEFDSLVIRR